jgi:hypothetical protein
MSSIDRQPPSAFYDSTFTIMAAGSASRPRTAHKQTEREVIRRSEEQLDALVGIYSLPSGPSGESVTYEISRNGNKLFAELKGLGSYPKYELFPSSATSLFSTSGLNVDFTLDAGRATSLKMGRDSRHSQTLNPVSSTSHYQLWPCLAVDALNPKILQSPHD